MQHGSLAVATAGSEKSSQFDDPAEGCCLEPAGGFAQGQNSNFHFHQTLCTAFNLRGAMLQPPFTDWYAGRGVTQSFALNQLTGDFDAVQPLFPVQICLL